jgi:hypothetical protein
VSICSLCGAQFDCALVDAGDSDKSDTPCWCTLLPAVVSLPSAPGSACWCRSCLQQHIAAQLADSSATF